MDEDNSEAIQKNDDVLKQYKDEISELEKNVNCLRKEYAQACFEIASLRSQRLSLEALVEGILVEDEVESCDIDEDTVYAEESNNSKTADSDFEIEEDSASASGSTEDSAIQYNRPVTRRTVKKEDTTVESEGMMTRSKVLKEAHESSKIEKGDSIATKACSSNESNQCIPEPNTEPISESGKDEDAKTRLPVIPSALPLLSHNPATGQPPNTIVDSKPAPMKRTYQDMSYLIPPIVASESVEKVHVQSPASTPLSKEAIPSPSQRAKSRPTSLDTTQSVPGTSFNPSSVSRSMIKNVVYNSAGTTMNQSLLYPQPNQMMRPAGSNVPTKQPMIKRSSGYGPMNDVPNRSYPPFTTISQGYDPYYPHMPIPAGMSPRVNPGFMAQQNRMPASRPMNYMNYYPSGLPGRMDYPAPMGLPMYVPGSYFPSMMVPMDGKVMGNLSRPGSLPSGLPPGLPPEMAQTMPQGMTPGIHQNLPQSVKPTVPQGIAQTVPPSIMQGGMRPMVNAGQQPVPIPNPVDLPTDVESQKPTSRNYLIPGIATDRDGNILPSS